MIIPFLELSDFFCAPAESSGLFNLEYLLSSLLSPTFFCLVLLVSIAIISSRSKSSVSAVVDLGEGEGRIGCDEDGDEEVGGVEGDNFVGVEGEESSVLLFLNDFSFFDSSFAEWPWSLMIT